jgi:hypothetical protein
LSNTSRKTPSIVTHDTPRQSSPRLLPLEIDSNFSLSRRARQNPFFLFLELLHILRTTRHYTSPSSKGHLDPGSYSVLAPPPKKSFVLSRLATCNSSISPIPASLIYATSDALLNAPCTCVHWHKIDNAGSNNPILERNSRVSVDLCEAIAIPSIAFSILERLCRVSASPRFDRF